MDRRALVERLWAENKIRVLFLADLKVGNEFHGELFLGMTEVIPTWVPSGATHVALHQGGRRLATLRFSHDEESWDRLLNACADLPGADLT